MAAYPKFVWMNGKLVETEKATVPFFNTTLHYGAGVFEGIRCYNTAKGPAVFRLKDHMDRLINSARILGVREFPFTSDELCKATKEVIKANGYTSCYIRPLLYLTSPLPSLNLDDGKAAVGIGVWEMGAYLGQAQIENGLKANVASFTRHHPNVSMTKAKVTGNYANSILAKTESIRFGFEEAIMLDPSGYVAECTGENIFLVRKGALYSPITADTLEGITRDSLITIIKELGFSVTETMIGRDQLYIADEVFMCGTAAELTPVSEIDGRVIGAGKMGPITRQIQAEFHKVVCGEHALSAKWLDYVG
ncbi:MAG: branched-chain amino acid transaminase [Leptolinea sp.]|jgi:branched-chain amino acid aminotransferase|nr:branched-chain amino acid transaminase [Leptolinea sp.]